MIEIWRDRATCIAQMKKIQIISGTGFGVGLILAAIFYRILGMDGKDPLTVVIHGIVEFLIFLLALATANRILMKRLPVLAGSLEAGYLRWSTILYDLMLVAGIIMACLWGYFRPAHYGGTMSLFWWFLIATLWNSLLHLKERKKRDLIITAIITLILLLPASGTIYELFLFFS